MAVQYHGADVLQARLTKQLLRICAALTLAISGGCGGGAPRVYATLTHSGVPIDSVLRLVSRVRLIETADHPIGSIYGLTLTPWGEIVIADGGMREVKVFGADGRLKRLLGRTGSGPGEFEMPMSVAMNDRGDGVVVTDAGLPRYLVYYRESAHTSPTTVQYVVPGIMVTRVVPWRGDSMVLLGATNRYAGDSLFDAAVITATGKLARFEFERPSEFNGRGLAVNLSVAYAARANSTRFFGSSIWGGIIRRRDDSQDEDTLFLPPTAYRTVVFPDTALKGPKGMNVFVKQNPRITEIVALNDSTLFASVEVWDEAEDVMRFKLLVVEWGGDTSVVETSAADAWLRGVTHDTLVFTRGDIGDTVWVEKYVYRRDNR